MKILVANLGSTSFKFRLYDLDGEQQLARGAIDRIGEEGSVVSIQIGEDGGGGSGVVESTATVSDHAVAVGVHRYRGLQVEVGRGEVANRGDDLVHRLCDGDPLACHRGGGA